VITEEHEARILALIEETMSHNGYKPVLLVAGPNYAEFVPSGEKVDSLPRYRITVTPTWRKLR
jgi:hypothetical protein